MLKSLRFLTLALLAAFGLTAHAETKSWNYQTYSASGSGEKVSIGYITVDEENGSATFKMYAPSLNNCFRATLKAVVEKTSDEVIVRVPPRYTGCDEVRFVLKADGTGGKRQVLNGDNWVDDGLERNLTIKN